MGFFDFLPKKQSKTGQAVSSEDTQEYLAMAVTFCSAYCLEMLAATKCLKSEITLEEEGAIDLGGYLMFTDVFTSTDILTRVAGNQRVFSPDEVNAVAKQTNCYSVCAQPALRDPQLQSPLQRGRRGACADICPELPRGLTPFTLCHPMYSEYIQAYFSPCRISEITTL